MLIPDTHILSVFPAEMMKKKQIEFEQSVNKDQRVKKAFLPLSPFPRGSIAEVTVSFFDSLK